DSYCTNERQPEFDPLRVLVILDMTPARRATARLDDCVGRVRRRSLPAIFTRALRVHADSAYRASLGRRSKNEGACTSREAGATVRAPRRSCARCGSAIEL